MIREKQLSKEIYKERKEKKQNISIKFLLFFFIFLLCGCSKDEISSVQFRQKMENEKYVVTDLSDEGKKVVLAVGDHYQVYYYHFSDENFAKESIEGEIKNLKNENNKIERFITSNYERYEIVNTNIYTIYSRIDHTYIYVSTFRRYRSEVIKLLKNIGYY